MINGKENIMPQYICHYHNIDGDLRGLSRMDHPPEIKCSACRAEQHFSQKEVLEFVRKAAIRPFQTMEVGGVTLECRVEGDAFSSRSITHEVRLVSGAWPDDQSLLELFDSRAKYFGGQVHKDHYGPGTAKVCVYRD
jgi:hypothetical protein